MFSSRIHVYKNSRAKHYGAPFFLRNTSRSFSTQGIKGEAGITVSSLKMKITPSVVSLRSQRGKADGAGVKIRSSVHLSRMITPVPNNNAIIKRVHPLKDD